MESKKRADALFIGLSSVFVSKLRLNMTFGVDPAKLGLIRAVKMLWFLRFTLLASFGGILVGACVLGVMLGLVAMTTALWTAFVCKERTHVQVEKGHREHFSPPCAAAPTTSTSGR